MLEEEVSDQNMDERSTGSSANGNDKGEATKDCRQDMESAQSKRIESIVQSGCDITATQMYICKEEEGFPAALRFFGGTTVRTAFC